MLNYKNGSVNAVLENNCSEIQPKHINTLSGQKVECPDVVPGGT